MSDFLSNQRARATSIRRAYQDFRDAVTLHINEADTDEEKALYDGLRGELPSLNYKIESIELFVGRAKRSV